jgi:hypothetical protein
MGTIAARIDITNGWQWPEFSGVSWTDPTDVNTWLVKFYVREVDAAHSPAGDGSGQWREWIQKQVLGTAGGSARVSDPGPWPKGDALPITYRDTADTHHYLEVQCVAVNRLSTSPADWNGADTASSVAQGARGFLDFGVKPSGKIPLTMYDPMTQLPGVQVTDIPGPAVGSMALSCPISNGLTLASGQLTYCWDGTITNLPVDPTYAGCEITVKYGSGVEGGAFCTLRGGQSTFHNGDWARPNADVAVQFKAYPISRDGKRGTPAVYNTTLTAQASYNPPAPVGNMTITSSVSVNALPANAPTVTITGTVGFGSVTNYTGCDLTMLWD